MLNQSPYYIHSKVKKFFFHNLQFRIYTSSEVGKRPRHAPDLPRSTPVLALKQRVSGSVGFAVTVIAPETGAITQCLGFVKCQWHLRERSS